MAKVHYNRLSEYTGENGGRVLILFLLFLLSLYSFINSGINGMAMYLALPFSILFVYLAFSNRMFAFWLLFLINYFVMFLGKEQLWPSGIPSSLPNELLEIVLIAIAIIDLRESHFENLANLMLVAVLGWCAFCILEVFNDTCGLGINIGSWFTGVRLMAFQLLYAVIVFALYINSPKRIYQLLFCTICSILGMEAKKHWMDIWRDVLAVCPRPPKTAYCQWYNKILWHFYRRSELWYSHGCCSCCFFYHHNYQ